MKRTAPKYMTQSTKVYDPEHQSVAERTQVYDLQIMAFALQAWNVSPVSKRNSDFVIDCLFIDFLRALSFDIFFFNFIPLSSLLCFNFSHSSFVSFCVPSHQVVVHILSYPICMPCRVKSSGQKNFVDCHISLFLYSIKCFLFFIVSLLLSLSFFLFNSVFHAE